MLFNIQRNMYDNGSDSLCLCYDTSYRLTKQGWGLLVVATVDHTGSGHPIALAIVSSEDSSCIQFVTEAIKLAFGRLLQWLNASGVTEF
jgi:MULE transposase domain